MDTSTTENAPESTEPKPEGNGTGEAANASEAAAQPQAGGNSEAAKYRRRLREAENTSSWLVAERDQQIAALQARIEAFQRDAVERIAAQHLRDGADFWSAGLELDDLRNAQTGELDLDRVAERSRDLAIDKPHWRKPGSTELASSVSGNQRIGDGTGRPAFADAFKPRNTGRG
ncbi:hypothetical protein LIX17_14615 [Mycobacterium avium subsp. hominissuis]|uniref:hypothetical protein n=1 Tax=Mycobacterium avium TaxID=1764 RepID=UPI00044A28CA|nr:hypothetical protein [Mycobacterium avium]ETZ54628.1 hypothetical protein L838_1610 [Mycobacterium avium MAV_120709_2344]MBG0730009.1 hypothetical protein [Mycobacterium avium]MCA2338081.1 hypothetical protein [Mycobacterium avium]MDV3219638.1 hypothetical protein [Mycobacterium avium]PBA40844.1 hypothetical protein CKJ63_14875 [Mycobacterium avium]